MAKNRRLTKEDLREIIARNLRETRANMVPKITQEEVAQLFDPPITRAAIAQWESGDTLPDIDRLAILSKAYGTTIDALVFDDNERQNGLTIEAVRIARTWMSLAKKHQGVIASLIMAMK